MPLVINVDTYVALDEINAKCLALGFFDFLTADEGTVEGYARQAVLYLGHAWAQRALRWINQLTPARVGFACNHVRAGIAVASHLGRHRS